MNKPLVRNKFTPREPTKVTDPGASLTQQHFKEETEINNIMKRYYKGIPLPVNTQPAMFGDFTSIDFQDMQNAIADIEQQFASLPAKLRNKFGYQPYQLIRWLENPANQDEAKRLGLIGPAELTPDQQLDLIVAANTPAPAPKADLEANPSFQNKPATEAGNAGNPA